MDNDLPKTREEAEALMEDFGLQLAQQGSADVMVYAPHGTLSALLALARIGIEAAFPSDETVERVAKRICVAGRGDYSDAAVAFSWGFDRPRYQERARAALTALTALAKGDDHD